MTMVNPHDEELLAELLVEWEELCERGQEAPAGELCKEHPHLAVELARRIAAMKATDWLNNPDPPAGDPPSVAVQPFQGRVLSGRYRLDDLIAEGGFAQVWRAYDTELQRFVAVKVPKPGRLESSNSFMAEARRVARLKHPGIVPVHDVGIDDDQCFIVSEFAEGGSLAGRLGREKPSHDQVVRWMCEVADALEYAHLHGVIHRDIKPANILIDHHGRALLADFGSPSRPRRRASSPRASARSATCLRSSWRAGRRRRSPTSTVSASCSTSASQGNCPTRRPTRRGFAGKSSLGRHRDPAVGCHRTLPACAARH